MGKMFPGEKVIFRNKNLFEELHDLSWMQLFLYGITGNIYGLNAAKLFEAIWTLCTSYPDPRIWNNRVASLAGTARSTGTLAISAVTAVSEATVFGRGPDIHALDFFVRAQTQLEDGVSLAKIVEEEMAQFRGIYGYGRPKFAKDERIAPLLSKATELGLADGPYTKLSFDVEKLLIEGRWRMRMNVAALAAALSADQGLSPRGYYYFLIPCFTAGAMPCFIEASEKQEGMFLPVSNNKIKYEGVPARRWNLSL